MRGVQAPDLSRLMHTGRAGRHSPLAGVDSLPRKALPAMEESTALRSRFISEPFAANHHRQGPRRNKGVPPSRLFDLPSPTARSQDPPSLPLPLPPMPEEPPCWAPRLGVGAPRGSPRAPCPPPPRSLSPEGPAAPSLPPRPPPASLPGTRRPQGGGGQPRHSLPSSSQAKGGSLAPQGGGRVAFPSPSMAPGGGRGRGAGDGRGWEPGLGERRPGRAEGRLMISPGRRAASEPGPASALPHGAGRPRARGASPPGTPP